MEVRRIQNAQEAAIPVADPGQRPKSGEGELNCAVFWCAEALFRYNRGDSPLALRTKKKALRAYQVALLKHLSSAGDPTAKEIDELQHQLIAVEEALALPPRLP